MMEMKVKGYGTLSNGHEAHIHSYVECVTQRDDQLSHVSLPHMTGQDCFPKLVSHAILRKMLQWV